jgi:hypothetical protein
MARPSDTPHLKQLIPFLAGMQVPGQHDRFFAVTRHESRMIERLVRSPYSAGPECRE